MRDMLFVFCYDISNDRTRQKFSEALEQFGTRVQESVFEIRTTSAKAEALLETLAARRGPGDKLRMYAIPEDGREKSRQFGGGPIGEATEFWLL